jgi:ParB-like chromosome segregation protein Spo0J
LLALHHFIEKGTFPAWHRPRGMFLIGDLDHQHAWQLVRELDSDQPAEKVVTWLGPGDLPRAAKRGAVTEVKRYLQRHTGEEPSRQREEQAMPAEILDSREVRGARCLTGFDHGRHLNREAGIALTPAIQEHDSPSISDVHT